MDDIKLYEQITGFKRSYGSCQHPCSQHFPSTRSHPTKNPQRIKDEIKYLHTKKQCLNQQLYHLHLDLAKSWDNIWNHMQISIDNKLHCEIAAKYKHLDKNLKPSKEHKNPLQKQKSHSNPE
jgi:hypothetical protein